MPKTAPEILAALTLAVLAWLIVAGAVLAGRRWLRQRRVPYVRTWRSVLVEMPPGHPYERKAFEALMAAEFRKDPLWSAFDIPTNHPEGN